MIYQYFNQKTSQGDITQETESWFETNNEAIYYKKVSSYEEYQKYKEKWPTIIDMAKEEFEDNFLIVVIATWRMPGISNAKQDGCVIVNNNQISSEDEERLDIFIENTKNGIEDYIRIFRRKELKEWRRRKYYYGY